MEIIQQRCVEYWQRYKLLSEKTMELDLAQIEKSNTEMIERDIRIIQVGISQHFQRCQQCHDWLMSFIQLPV